MTRRYLSITLASLALIWAGTETMARRGRFSSGAVRTRGGAAVRPLPHSLPSNYGSMRTATVRSATSFEGSPRIQPVPEEGSGSTYRGGDVAWRTTPGGHTALKGETARGRDYGGVRSAEGERAAVLKTHGDEVVVRNREGDVNAYEKVGDTWKEVDDFDLPYYYDDDDYLWYSPYFYGGRVVYHEVYPPVGAEVDMLPEGTELVEIDGQTYLLWDGVYYVEVDGHYQVAADPSGAADPVEIVDRMAAFLAAQPAFRFHADERVAVPREDGRFETVAIQRTFVVQRPDKLVVSRREGTEARQFWFDGERATLFDPGQRYYGQIPLSGDLADMLDRLERDYGVILPLSDLFQAGLAEQLQPELASAMYRGRKTVGGAECHHIALTNDEVEAELWIDVSQGTPYLRKVILRYPNTPGQPTYQAVLSEWVMGANLPGSQFRFEPPEGARQVEMMQVAD